MTKKKIVLLLATIVTSIILILILGVSLAIVEQTLVSSDEQLVLGDIYMHFRDKNQISLSNVFPGGEYENYFEFTISGKNTYTEKDIWYDVVLTRGEVPSGKTEANRIPDRYLNFKLVEVVDGVENIIFTDKNYDNLTNQKIHAEIIGKNTITEISKTYRLYMVISSSLLIGNTQSAVMTSEEYANTFANVEVKVTGDFISKKIPTYEDCFATSVNSDGTLTITNYYKYDSSSSDPLYQNPLCTSDVIIPSSIEGIMVTGIKGGSWGYDGAFMSKGLTSVVIPDTITSIGKAAFNKNSLPDDQAYIYARTDKNNDGIGEIDTTSLISYGGANTNPVIPTGVTSIEEECFYALPVKTVTLPNGIDKIGLRAFREAQLTSLDLPNTLTTIEEQAFFGVYDLFKLIIPDSVTTIGREAFAYCRISNVTLGSGIIYMGEAVFKNNSVSTITTTKTCSELKSLPGSDYDTNLYYPWMNYGTSSSSSGLTIYGANNEVCDAF